MKIHGKRQFFSKKLFVYRGKCHLVANRPQNQVDDAAK